MIRPDDRPLALGYSLRRMYECTEPATDSSCVFDNYLCNNTRVPQRVGTAGRGHAERVACAVHGS